MKIFTSNSLLLLLQNLKTKLDSKSDTNHTHSISNITNLQNTLDSKAASSHTHSAYVNQNTFSNVVVGSTTVAADSTTDTLTLVAGSNVTLTPDATNDKITISATDTKYSTATTSVAGLMSASDKSKLDGIATGANNYSLPTATSSVLGGVKVGSNITNSSGTISLSKANVTSALGYTPPTTNTTYSVATTSANGLMSSTDKQKLDNINAVGTFTLDGTTLNITSTSTIFSLSGTTLTITSE